MSSSSSYSPLAYTGVNPFTNPPTIIASRAPVNGVDFDYFVGQKWIYFQAAQEFTFFGASDGWQITASSSGTLNTLSDTANTPVDALAGNIQLKGSTGIQVLSNPGTNSIGFSLTNMGLSIDTITGNNTGYNIPPDGSSNLNVVGDNNTGIQAHGAGNTLTISGLASSSSQIGTIALASSAEAISGSNGGKAVTPATLTSKLGSQTNHAIAFGTGNTQALTYLGEATNGQIPIGNTGNFPTLGLPTGSNGIVVQPGGGTLNFTLSGVPASAITGANYQFTPGANVTINGSSSPQTIALGGNVTISADTTGVSYNVTAVTAPSTTYNVQNSDYYIVVSSSGSSSIVLPPPSLGRTLLVKNIRIGTVTITGGTIENQTSYVLPGTGLFPSVYIFCYDVSGNLWGIISST